MQIEIRISDMHAETARDCNVRETNEKDSMQNNRRIYIPVNDKQTMIIDKTSRPTFTFSGAVRFSTGLMQFLLLFPFSINLFIFDLPRNFHHVFIFTKPPLKHYSIPNFSDIQVSNKSQTFIEL